MVREGSQIASFNLLRHPTICLLKLSVASPASVHKSNVKRRSYKWEGGSETQSPRPFTSGVQQGGGDEGVGDGQRINQDTIWHHGALETPTTVSNAAVLLRRPCAPFEGGQQLWTGVGGGGKFCSHSNTLAHTLMPSFSSRGGGRRLFSLHSEQKHLHHDTTLKSIIFSF